MPKLIKKILALWLIIYLIIIPPFAYAASAGGWAFNSFNVATSVVTALKNGASASVAVAKSPITSKIAKGIVGGAIAGAALPLAISQLTGIALSAVDWVLDPANNTINYKRKIDANTYDYKSSASGKTYPSPELACDYLTVANGGKGIAGATFSHLDVAKGICYYSYNGSLYDWSTVQKITPTNQSGSIPIPTVADKIYDNAKTDSASASIVNDAVKDYVNSGAADVALDNAKADTDASHACGTGTHWSGSACVADTPSTPSTPTTPDTPFDPTDIIDAIGKVFDAVMSLPDVINNALDDLLNDIKDFFQPAIDKVTDIIDWVKSEPDPQSDNKPDIDTTQPTKSANDFDTDYLRFGGQCPSFSPTTISVGIVAVPISFNAQPLCDFAILCRPIILALAYFAAMAIVANAIRSE